jgi:hypothetical protein
VARRVDDVDVFHLLKLMLKANGQRGVPQGGVISPLPREEIRTLRSTWRGLETWHGRADRVFGNDTGPEHGRIIPLADVGFAYQG